MKVLIVGANYGLLLAGMLREREILVDVIGTDKQIDILNREGFSLKAKNKSWKFNPSKSLNFLYNFENYNYDLVVMAIQESHLLSLKLTDLVRQISKRKIPIMSVMNIPFYQFIENIIGIKNINYPEKIYYSLKISNLLNADLIINSNPEPQVFSEGKFNLINIRLGGVFRCSTLQMLKKDFISKLTNNIDNGLPAIIKEYKSPWVSLSKLPMLITGNYRCLENYQLISINEAVRYDIKISEKIYNQVVDIMKKSGAGRESIIPFKAYLNASINLDAPSSVCRSIVNGNKEVDRVDRLIQELGKSVGVISREIDDICENIDNSIKKFSLKT